MHREAFCEAKDVCVSDLQELRRAVLSKSSGETASDVLQNIAIAVCQVATRKTQEETHQDTTGGDSL